MYEIENEKLKKIEKYQKFFRIKIVTTKNRK